MKTFVTKGEFGSFSEISSLLFDTMFSKLSAAEIQKEYVCGKGLNNNMILSTVIMSCLKKGFPQRIPKVKFYIKRMPVYSTANIFRHNTVLLTVHSVVNIGQLRSWPQCIYTLNQCNGKAQIIRDMSLKRGPDTLLIFCTANFFTSLQHKLLTFYIFPLADTFWLFHNRPLYENIVGNREIINYENKSPFLSFLPLSIS